MKYTLDANVAAKWVLPEVDSANALRIKDDFRHGVHELIAPDIFCIEVAHTLVRAERKKLINHMPQHFADVMALSPDLADSLALLGSAIDLARSLHRGVYDCIYLRLAEREQAPLITADTQLLNLIGYPIVNLASF